MAEIPKSITILGGTGNLGRGLALRWANSGIDIIIGSRSAERAAGSAAELNEELGSEHVRGLVTEEAASAGELVVIAVPFTAHADTLSAVRKAVQGKIVIDATVPLVPPKVARVQLPEGGAAALRTQETLGEDARVVAAFHNVAAAHLAELGHAIDCDVLVCGDDRESREVVVALAERIGMTAVQAGPLANSVALESLTPVLIWINRNRKIPGAGIRLTGLDG
jgi:NADPH-dependent F420 reductase